MAECKRCKRIIGAEGGVFPANQETIDQALQRGIFTIGLCGPCLQQEIAKKAGFKHEMLKREQQEKQARDMEEARERQRIEENKRAMREAELDAIVLSTTAHPEEWTRDIVGIVNGFSVIGTGPLAGLLSNVTDLLGIESKSYHDKLVKAKNNALERAKEEAHALGANMIFGIQVNITEIGANISMLLVSVTGTALKRKV